MTSLIPITIGSYKEGLHKDKKPFLLNDTAFSDLENAYVWRERVKKREGVRLLGRLRRVFTNASVGNAGGSPWTFTIYSSLTPAITGEPDAEIEPGSVTITIAGPIAFTDHPTGVITGITQANPAAVTSVAHGLQTNDQVNIASVGGMAQINGGPYVITVTGANSFTLNGVDSTNYSAYTAGGTWTKVPNGRLTSATAGNSGFINYTTGVVVLTHTAGAVATTITFNYFPSFPVMGLKTRETGDVNQEETVAFDTKYAYRFVNTGFQEATTTSATWAGTDSDFFWTTNYRGSTPQSRLFFATNFVNDAADPMRHWDGSPANPWVDFFPIVSQPGAVATRTYLTSALILIPYYGRLLALNVWESPDDGAGNPNRASGVNIFNRCRYSQIGDPTAADGWRSDQFGKGGFIDAPTSEAIIGATFFKNTLIVRFERSTWQLRYVGEYGIPFIWERISSDFGSESTFSDVLFDRGVLSVGDRAITISGGMDVQRVDENIPDAVFNYRNADDGVKRVHGIRDFQKELVFWCYSDSLLQRKFPNYVQVYNYRNNTWALFRDSVTTFGTFQPSNPITWNNEDIYWDDEDVTWNYVDAQSEFPYIISGNQQGYVHYYGYRTPDEQSLSVTGVDLTTNPIRLTVDNHNLENDEIIYITGLNFLDTSNNPVTTDLNNKLYQVIRIDANTIGLAKWNTATQSYYTNFTFTPATTSTYVGGGQIALMPKLYVATKDFNPFQSKGMQMKLSYVDFLMDAVDGGVVTVELFINSSLAVLGNLLVGNSNVESDIPAPYYVGMSDYAWHRFFATAVGQYIRIAVTYNDDLMNTLTTHEQTFVLNAMQLYCRPGGKLVF